MSDEKYNGTEGLDPRLEREREREREFEFETELYLTIIFANNLPHQTFIQVYKYTAKYFTWQKFNHFQKLYKELHYNTKSSQMSINHSYLCKIYNQLIL